VAKKRALNDLAEPIDLFLNNNWRPLPHILAAACFGKIHQYGYIDSLTSTSPRSKYDQTGFEDYSGTSLINGVGVKISG
jgi:hypothetical protein